MAGKYTDRKRIEEFLVALDGFIGRYSEEFPTIGILMSAPIRFGYDHRKSGSKASNEGLENLVVACNRMSQSRAVIAANRRHSEDSDEMEPYPDSEKRLIRRSALFVRESAYGIEYAETVDLCYYNVFAKFALANDIELPIKLRYEGFTTEYRDSLSSLLVPAEWITDDSLVIL